LDHQVFQFWGENKKLVIDLVSFEFIQFVAGKQFERSLFLCTDKEQPSGFNQQNFGLGKPQRCGLVQATRRQQQSHELDVTRTTRAKD
jgi:hypothetical protein